MVKNNEDSIVINYSISRVVGTLVAVQSYAKIISPAVMLASRVPLMGISPVMAVATGVLLAYQLYSKTDESVSAVLDHTPIDNNSTITIDKAKIRSIKSRLMKLKLNRNNL